MGASSALRPDPFPSSHDPLPHAVWFALRTHPIFASFSDADFEKVSRLLRSRKLLPGEVVVQQGELDTNLYIIRRGRALLRKADLKGRDPIREVLEPGKVVNEVGFLTHLHNDITVEALTPLQVWYIPGDAFTKLLEQEPALKTQLGQPESVLRYLNDLAARQRVKAAQEDERVLWFDRRHWSWLATRITPGALALLIGIPLLVVHRLFGDFSGVGLAGGIGLCVLGVLVVTWHLIDYFNDYFMVTDRRVIHRERVVLLYDSLDEASLARVQNVTVIRSNALATLFNVGDVLIETQGASANVRFDWVARPDEVSSLIKREQQRARAEFTASRRHEVRTELLQEMGYLQKPDAPAKPTPPKRRLALPSYKALFTKLSNLGYELMPRVKLKRDKRIIYRKHWLVLLRNVSLPALALLVYVGALAVLIFVLPALFSLGLVLTVPLALLGLAILLRLVWKYEDWRNDLYILTEDSLIDYKRSPFGLLGDTQRTALLVNVQNITATTRGPFDTFFNIGDVSIRTAGLENELLFARVYDPRGVQREIVRQMEIAQARRAAEEAAQRRREFIEWIGIYDELTRIYPDRPPLV